MTDQERVAERVAVKDYIDARITPIVADLGRIEHKVDRLFTKIDIVRSNDDRSDGADAMKRTIWKAAAAIVTAVCAIGGMVVAILT